MAFARMLSGGEFDEAAVPLTPSRRREPAVDEAAVEEEQATWRKIVVNLALLVVYLALGCALFGYLENWYPSQTMVFLLAVLTGTGYGHVAPTKEASKIVSVVFIILGMVVFAVAVGLVLNFIMQWQIDYLTDIVRSQSTGADSASYEQKRKRQQRLQLGVGVFNVSCILASAVMLVFLLENTSLVEAVYQGTILAFKLDSLCALPSVHCGESDSDGGTGHSRRDAISSFMWCAVTYGAVSHFLVSFSSITGIDSARSLSRLKVLDHSRVKRMDKDRNGKVTRTEFLCDRLVRGGVCSSEQLGAILKNFDDLDVDGSGLLSVDDIRSTT